MNGFKILKKRWIKRIAALSFKYFGLFSMIVACYAAAINWTSLGSWALGGMVLWGILCLIPSVINYIKILAKNSRAPKKNGWSKMFKNVGSEFHKLSNVEQAMAARADIQIQRRFWWDAAAVMWMKSNPGREHLWTGLMSSPNWLDDSITWLYETTDKLEEAADHGWICPNIKMSDLISRPEMCNSKKELGDDIEGFTKLGDPWPSKARYCDTLASMGHKLFEQGYSESLVWRSHGALERIKMSDYMDRISRSDTKLGKKKRL